MYQHKDKSDKVPSSSNDEVLQLFALLESSKPEDVGTVKTMIHENLTSCKDSKLLNCIVDYYLAVLSERSLDILVCVKEPHDRHLFDKINELIKNENSRYQSLQLLCSLIYKQPIWVHKIISHRVMNSIFTVLKTDMDPRNLISALFIVVCILPMIPSNFGPYLQDTFDIFSRLAAWNIRKPANMSEVYVLHLQIGIYSLFHRLYGMFPCNFLAYLRSYYGGREYSEENYRIFSRCIKPMLERVRLHPLLVTASKETELNVNRWKKMAYHDVIVDCASVSLDAIEGSLENLNIKNQNPELQRQSSGGMYDSIQYASFSSQSSTSMSFEMGGMVNEGIAAGREVMWSPSHTCGFSVQTHSIRNTVSPSVKSQPRLKSLNSQLSDENVPLDLAVEAKPDKMEDDKDIVVPDVVSHVPLRDLTFDMKSSTESTDATFSSNLKKNVPAPEDNELCSVDSINSSIEKSVQSEVKDIDKEVSELTSCSNKSIANDSPTESRHDTPFCSTTQNLTSEPPTLPNSSISQSEMVTNTSEEVIEEMCHNVQDVEVFETPFESLQHFSQGGHVSANLSETLKKPQATYSVLTASEKLCNVSESKPDATETHTAVSRSSSNIITTSSAFISLSDDASVSTPKNFTYEQLIPMATETHTETSQTSDQNSESNPNRGVFKHVSPHELLDNYILFGNNAYINQISTIPIPSTKNTDWTHFGGKPPPDEVEIMRNQILLLHHQLLFERHRKDAHSERVRRILGRAKRYRMQEELIIALKEQINLLENDKENLKRELTHKTKLLEQLKVEKRQIEDDLNCLIMRVKHDNSQLLFANKKLQSLLVSQKEQNDKLTQECKLRLSEIVNLTFELDQSTEKCLVFKKMESEHEYMSKQMFLLQEINSMYKRKHEQSQEPSDPSIECVLINEAALCEIQELKANLEITCSQLDVAKTRIASLEQHIANLKAKENEQHILLENMKSVEKEETYTRQYIREVKKVCIVQESQILELYKENEILSDKLNVLEKELKKVKTQKDISPQTSELNLESAQSSCSRETDATAKTSQT